MRLTEARDQPEPEYQSMPSRLVPMQAKVGSLPASDSNWAFEIKWDGVRALVYSDFGAVRVESRNLHDITSNFPELCKESNALKKRSFILDGEIVAPLENGNASFERLQGRLGLVSKDAVTNQIEMIPVVFMIFDLLYLDGKTLMQLPYIERRRLLSRLNPAGPHWQISEYRIGSGEALLDVAGKQGLEGIMAKRLDSRYDPGKRTGAWLKIKLRRRQELVIGGWTEGKKHRGEIGSLMVGYYDMLVVEARKHRRRQRFVYAGNVGTGFTARDLENLSIRLKPLRRASSPFSDRSSKKGSVFVEPKLVAEFEFTEWTGSGILRQPSYKGLRFDKDPHEVVREEVS